MSGSIGRILFNTVAGDWQDVVSSLFNCRVSSDGCMHLPKAQSGHWISEEIPHSSKFFVLPMLVINSFDFSLNGLNSSVLFKSSIEESRFGCVSKCWNSLFVFGDEFGKWSATCDMKMQRTVSAMTKILWECLGAGFRHSRFCESGSLALLSDNVVFGRGARCTVSSWRRSCCPGGAACCGVLEERRCGRDQQGDDMADRMTDYFMRTKMPQQ